MEELQEFFCQKDWENFGKFLFLIMEVATL
jgi:hypothetical protein